MPNFPVLNPPTGLGWGYRLSPKFSTITQTPQSGRGAVSATLQQGTLFDVELVFNYLKTSQWAGGGQTYSDDFEYMKSFFEAMRGSWGRFLFDPSNVGQEPSVTNYQNLTLTEDLTQLANGFCGVGDGTTTTFPMWRSSSVLGNGVVTQLERIQNVTNLQGVYLNGTLQQAGYTTANFPATLTFATPPAAGQTVAWAGSYSLLCRFEEDSVDFNLFLQDLWDLKSVKLETLNL